MIALKECFSDLAGKSYPATICPTLVSEVDGKTIMEGIPDIDLLDMWEFGVDEHGRVMPIDLIEGKKRKVPARCVKGMLKSWAKGRKIAMKKQDREDNFAAHQARIRANESSWMDYPKDCDDEFMYSLLKIMVAMS